MKNHIILLIFIFSSFSTFAQKKINWLTIDQAEALQQQQPKKMLIYFYTDWCGVCKSLERTVFKDQKFISKLNKNYYPVKLNPEHKATITFNNKQYAFVGDDLKGKNALAYEAMNDVMAFPAMAFYDENYNKINTIIGKQKKTLLLQYLDYISSNSYKSTKWFDYSSQEY